MTWYFKAMHYDYNTGVYTRCYEGNRY
ncbi:LCI fold-containing protein [Bacillus manliponensis]